MNMLQQRQLGIIDDLTSDLGSDFKIHRRLGTPKDFINSVFEHFPVYSVDQFCTQVHQILDMYGIEDAVAFGHSMSSLQERLLDKQGVRVKHYKRHQRDNRYFSDLTREYHNWSDYHMATLSIFSVTEHADQNYSDRDTTGKFGLIYYLSDEFFAAGLNTITFNELRVLLELKTMHPEILSNTEIIIVAE